ncbi:hypothetical protein QTH91_12795 [Variovorax dokdonensis]|uniref:Uncharacterized protein n=1 Tax=Variovorax dokdonensis TaxID=344883 RepID=A0ABT7NBR4_9BURK|nr:hypothetical protein [Variovorax dokdonensis]MDM0045366.1 hypothetical protein [Variovorax dokdonensis]
MSVEFLRQIAATPLPKSFTAKKELDAIKILRQAGLVLAMFDEPPEFGARVLAITEKGRAELLQLHYPTHAHGCGSTSFWLPRVAKRAKDVLKRSIGVG